MQRLFTGIVWTTVAVVALGGSVPVRAAGARVGQAGVSLTVFDDGLAPYGAWISSGRYGRVWTPRGVHANWRPYSVGTWRYTDAGWTWMSDEPWGWATYHYGRWTFDSMLGWIWVPDTVWGPAWVAWRSNADYIGWAPLGPGVAVTETFDPVIEPYAFVFVRAPYLCDERLATFIEPPARNVTFVGLTVNATRFNIRGDVFVNVGPRVEVVERAIGHPVPRLTIAAVETLGPARVDRDRLVVYRPHTLVVTGRAVPRPVGHVETIQEMNARHTDEVRALQADQVRARETLEARHRDELAHPPSGVSHEQLLARQESEHKAQQAQEAREQQVLQARHAQEAHDHGRGR